MPQPCGLARLASLTDETDQTDGTDQTDQIVSPFPLVALGLKVQRRVPGTLHTHALDWYQGEGVRCKLWRVSSYGQSH